MPIITDITFERADTMLLEVAKVYWRTEWADEWREMFDVHPLRCTWAVSPQMSSAQLYFRYGWGMMPGDQALNEIAKQSAIDRLWIKIEWPADYLRGIEYTDFFGEDVESESGSSGFMRWYGTLEIEQDMPDRSINRPETDPDELFFDPAARVDTPQGRQVFICYGLENLLRNKIITDSQIEWYPLFFDKVDRGLTFNRNGKPNRTTWKWQDTFGGANTYGFASGEAGADFWSSADILEYLVGTQMPRDEAGNQSRVPWEVPAGAYYPLPQLDRPIIDTHNVPVYRVLDALLSRQRLAGYHVHVDENTDPATLQIIPFTFAHKDVALPEGEHITANTVQLRVLLDDDPTANHRIQIDHSHVVDRVRVRGARRRSCFSASYGDGTIAAGWTTEAEDRLNSIVGSIANDETRDQELILALAQSAPEVADVYARFLIPLAFSGKVAQGTADTGDSLNDTPEYTEAFPDDDNPDVGVPFDRHSFAILSRLPLRADVDYSNDRIETGAAFHDGDDIEKEMMPICFGFHKNDPTDWENFIQFGYALWFNFADSGRQANIEPGGEDESPGLNWSAQLTTEPESRALRVKVIGGPQTVLSSDNGITSGDRVYPGYDWQNMVFTLAVQEDRLCEVAFPEELTDPIDIARELVIDAGPSYRLDYVCPGTVVGINETTLDLLRSTGGIVRDDRPALKEIARLAWEWYGTPRVALEWSTSWPTDLIRVGDLVRYLGPEGDTQREINAVVTQITIESQLARGGERPAPPRIEYSTQFAELDLIRP